MKTFKNFDARHGDVNHSRELTANEFRQLRWQDEDQTPAERAGLAISVAVLVVSLIALVMWAESRSSFERCSARVDADARAACYEELRQQEMRPPAKGAYAPVGLSAPQK
jgi:hypothetical protein